GTDGAITVCDQGAAVGLFAQLGGTPDAGGTWTDPLGNAHSGSFDPAADPAGIYTYTLAALAPCLGDASTVTVTLTSTPDAGTDGAITVCDQGAAVGLFAQLGGTPDAGGTWTDPLGNAHSGSFDPGTDAAGVYTYTLAALAPCLGDASTVTVTLTSTPDAGTDGAITVCDQGAAVGLFAQLGGTPDAGGTWTDPLGNAHSGSFDPGTDAAGVYTYTLAATAPCQSTSSVVLVAVEVAPNAGSNGALTVCAGASAELLLPQLVGSPDPNGTWTDPNGVAFTGLFDPGSDPAGTYTYAVPGTVCAAATSTVQVTVLVGPDAGVDNSLTLCSTGAITDLFLSLGGTPDAGGSWTDPNGVVTTSSFDPTNDPAGTYTYTVSGNGQCPDDLATIAVSVQSAAFAGTAGSLSLCTNGAVTDLFAQLGGGPQPGGSWTDPNGAPIGSFFDPATGTPGTYTYLVSGLLPCPDASATVLVDVTEAPDAGQDAVVTLCSADGPLALTGLLGGTPDGGGSWTGPGGTTIGAQIDPAVAVPGNYLYVVAASAPCANDTAILMVAVQPAPNAGANNAVNACADAAPIDLATLLGPNADVNGAWTAPNGQNIGAVIDPGTAASGIYTYTVSGTAPCPDASAGIEVTIIPVPDPQVFVAMSDGCAPALVDLSTDHVGPGTFLWNLGNGTTSDSSVVVDALYDQPGTYDITLTIDAGNGCSATVVLQDAVAVFERPVAAFTMLPPVVSTLDPTVYFNNTSIGATAYSWDFGGLGTSTATDPVFEFPDALEGQYEVCLIAYAAPTCADTLCQPITVSPELVVNVPNAFTPDGDNVNDRFKPVTIGVDPDQYLFRITDRWGQVLYSTNDPEAAWDGRYANGEEVQQGVYIWQLEAKGNTTTARIARTGHVTLVR
ncbi:MAG: gliding motility-associated C-terminal domain-containing protein, partial [Flavobacteriales bacterium]|nr:gliding motility-associated C-terminal domain-containing protein [Flavobacteriales bacterium]